MATKSENADIAVLQTQMSNVETAVNRIEGKLDKQSDNFGKQIASYVTKTEFDAFKKSVRVNYLLVVIITAVITALVYNYFKAKP